MNIGQELERTAHDLMAAPSVRDNVEIAVAGAAVGALLGYLKSRSKAGAFEYAKWGAGIGLAGQYMVFHMLKPSMRAYALTSSVAAQSALPQQFHGFPHGGY